MTAYLILFIKVLKSHRQLFGAKNIVAFFLPNFLLFIYIFRKWSCILFIKGLKSLRQLLGAKNVVALFLHIFCYFYIYRKWSCILFIKGLMSLRQLFGVENVVKSNVLKGFYYLSFGSIINDFFITRIRPRVNPNPHQWFFITRIGPRVNLNPLSIYINFGCIYEHIQ